MYPINVVEKETGISKYLLRMWERRYTFPRPERDSKGERIYSSQDVEKLKLVKALMENGYRPSKIISLEINELKLLQKSFSLKESEEVVIVTSPELLQEVQDLLKNHKPNSVLIINNREDLKKIAM